MTSEVVVMNRLGVALASDSAATVYVEGRPKFYHADKLFMLSDHQPIGAMVYNNSSLLGVPWETILKLFRAQLGNKERDTVEDYAAELIAFVSGNKQLFPPDAQSQYFVLMVETLFKHISNEVKTQFYQGASDQLREESAPGSKALQALQASVVSQILEDWRKKPDVDPMCFGPDVPRSVVGSASSQIADLAARFFPGAGNDVVSNLYELVRLVVGKDEIPTESLSGLVIAGFGSKQHFPAMQQYEVGEIFLDRLKYRCLETLTIDAGRPSIIKPFAQSSTMETFLHGVSPSYEINMVEELVNAVVNSPEEIIDGFPGVSKARKEAYKEKVLPVSMEAAKALVRRLRSFRDQNRSPILQAIEFLPKNELAHVASSLVNLSSFQKRMSISEDETVGGPIDVAVISKGDGFVWIDRKHYFKPELNRHFFRNRIAESGR